MNNQEQLKEWLKEEGIKRGISAEEIELISQYAFETKETVCKKYEKEANKYLDSIQDKEKRKEAFKEFLDFNKCYRS